MSDDEFQKIINSCKERYGDLYDYGNAVNPQKMSGKITISCLKHGIFEKRLDRHLNGEGCPKCSGKYKWNTAEWIEEAKRIYGDKYNFSKSEYKGYRKKIVIIENNEERSVYPIPFINGDEQKRTVRKNLRTNRLTNTEFIERCKNVWGDEYDLSNVNYNGMHSYIYPACKIHGIFKISPINFLNHHGCSKCNCNVKLSSEDFINKSNQIHEGKYDYSKVVYKNRSEKVIIICPIHGEFEQRPIDHLNGRGCPICGGVKKWNTDEWVEEAKRRFGDKYDYSKVKYEGWNKKINIICPIHGKFEQLPYSHMQGHGCPRCNESLMEKEISELLINEDIKFVIQKRFNWLGLQSLDFYLPDYKIGIECQGEQHFKQCAYFGNKLEEIKERDKNKRELCKKNGIKIIYYSNLSMNYPYDVFEDKNNLIKEIKKSTKNERLL